MQDDPATAESNTDTGQDDALRAELAEVKDKLLRALAEQQNIRQRTARECQDRVKYAAADFGRDLLGVADNLRRALSSVPKQISDDVRQWLTGVEATEHMLQEAFERHGIKRLDPLGTPFDPNFHQAVFAAPDETRPPGTVIEVMAPGYIQHERLLRPAMVGVAKEPEPAPAKDAALPTSE